jgi:23S rRNA pseudouridine2605 synthase
LTSEQLEAARAERMRQNGHGTLTLEDARTWIEETGLCLFLPRRQFSSSVAPSFVEAIAGQRDQTPEPRHIAAAEELLVRLETEGVAVRLNLLGQPGEQPDFVVAGWVLPYVYALRGDRDWRRSPQLTGSRQVSQLAVQAYKLLEAGDSTISQLKQTLGREVTEVAVLRAITELWQQLRIIPIVSAPGQPARWQLLRQRFQKAIAEGASTSQVTAISVLASIYLQAVIAASMEEVEVFLAPLTARSKVREVLRGLVATRQVHTISLGHAPHFYVAGTLPEFATAPTIYSSAYMQASSYFTRTLDREEEPLEHPSASPRPHPVASSSESRRAVESHAARTPVRKPAAAGKPAPARPHFNRPATHSRDRKPAASSSTASRPARRGADARPAGARPQSSSRPASARWSPSAPKSTNGKHGGNGAASSNGTRSAVNGARSKSAPARPAGKSSTRSAKPSAAAWSKHSGRASGIKAAGKSGAGSRTGSVARKDSRADARPSRGSRKPAMTAGAGAGNSKRYGFTARPKQGTKKRG